MINIAFKTYYIHTWNSYDVSGFITKAESLKEAKQKFKHYINRYYKHDDISLNNIQELDKTEIVSFIC